MQHDTVSDAVAVEIRSMIVDGRLPPGERINEVHLATQLGVSRTPLREALARLAHEGALRAVPRIGYSVLALTLEEFEQIYPIRPLLDPEALRLAGVPARETLDELRAINDELERAKKPEEIIRLDDEWHLLLVDGCPNKVLLDLIKQFMLRTRRYELALLRDAKNASRACAEHRRITAALKRRDLEGACDALRSNLQSGYAPILDWLKGHR